MSYILLHIAPTYFESVQFVPVFVIEGKRGQVKVWIYVRINSSNLRDNEQIAVGNFVFNYPPCLIHIPSILWKRLFIYFLLAVFLYWNLIGLLLEDQLALSGATLQASL